MANITKKQSGKIGCSFFAFVFAVSLVCVQGAYADREVLRGAAGGALGGAAVGKLSDGDAGKGAAWGAGMGAVKGVAAKKRAEEEAAVAQEQAQKDARIHELELQQAYEKGKSDGAAKPAAARSSESR